MEWDWGLVAINSASIVRDRSVKQFSSHKWKIAHCYFRCSLIWKIVLAAHRSLDSKCRSFSLSTLKDKSAMCSSVRGSFSSVGSGSCTSVKAMRIWEPQQRQYSYDQNMTNNFALLPRISRPPRSSQVEPTHSGRKVSFLQTNSKFRIHSCGACSDCLLPMP